MKYMQIDKNNTSSSSAGARRASKTTGKNKNIDKNKKIVIKGIF